MSAIPEPFKKGGGLFTKQGVCRHSGHWFAWSVDGSVVLVDGVGGGSGGVPTMWWVGPGGTIGRFLPLEVSDKGEECTL